jgi:uncharacterized damage-inducible protein DinB
MSSPLTEAWDIAARITVYLLDNLPEGGWEAELAKGKSVAAQFAHLHNVRLMWLKASAPHLHEGQVKLEKASREETRAALEASAAAISQMIQDAEDAGARVKNFKPHTAAFVGYMASHEACHRAQVELALRQTGLKLDQKIEYGQWEWGVR